MEPHHLPQKPIISNANVFFFLQCAPGYWPWLLVLGLGYWSWFLVLGTGLGYWYVLQVLATGLGFGYSFLALVSVLSHTTTYYLSLTT